ncbi:MAG: class I adenylate-forming enzyme family protein, partial [Acidimicrobiia bacterium]
IDRAGMTARLFVNAFELGAAPEDVFVESLPMFHISAYLAYAYIFVGATVVMLPVFTPEDCLDVLAREQATSTVLVPTMIRMVMDSPAVADFDASHLQLTIYGGESIEPGLLRRAMEQLGCGFHQQYGMTETGAQTILRPADHDPANIEALSSAGSDAISFEVRIVDGDDRQLPDGEIGEIVCRGPAVMSGYWKRHDATAETLRNGWMHTGDVGYRDGQRLLHIVDRRNDMVVSGGENVYPREVERELLGHPDVADATVIGLPDAKWGEAVTAVVVGEHPSDEDLAAYLRERLAGYKVPRRWIRLDELPRNAGGKVLKGELRRTLKT